VSKPHSKVAIVGGALVELSQLFILLQTKNSYKIKWPLRPWVETSVHGDECDRLVLVLHLHHVRSQVFGSLDRKVPVEVLGTVQTRNIEVVWNFHSENLQRIL